MDTSPIPGFITRKQASEPREPFSVIGVEPLNSPMPKFSGARDKYDQWAAKIWEGRVDDVIDELTAYDTKLGEPPSDARNDDPREVIRVSRGYYENHTDRMNYPHYRREGFLLTSSLMESTVKQVSRRVKGTEKYWSSAGGEAILRLRGEYLSEDTQMQSYWTNRSRHATGTRAYSRTPVPTMNA